ncbi:MAG: glycosyltransferase [Betaproteobacteria bacterium]|nr:glycosyltransferase [Betaproteobacteria bacterium]
MSCDTAGTQKQLLQMIRRIDRARFDPILICLWSSPWMESADLPCDTIVLGHEGFLKWSFPGVVRRLSHLIDKHHVDLVHVFFDESIFVTWIGTLASRRRPVLVSSRRDMGLGTGNQPWYHNLFPWVLMFANRDFAAIVTNAESVSRYAARRERTQAAKFVVVHNGVDLAVTPPAASPLPGGRPAVGIVASLTPVKRHDVLLMAWATLARRAPLGVVHFTCWRWAIARRSRTPGDRSRRPRFGSLSRLCVRRRCLPGFSGHRRAVFGSRGVVECDTGVHGLRATDCGHTGRRQP